MKNKTIALLLVGMVTVLSIAGCGKKDNSPSNGDSTSSLASAVEILNDVWDNFPENDKFDTIGGGTDNAVENKPGSVDITDTDTLTYSLLVPESLQSEISEAASLVHMLNANTYTSVALKLKDADKDEFVETLKTDILNARFMCGFPERLVIISVGDYVAYAYGADDLVTTFKDIASEKIEGVKVEVDQLFE